MIRKLRRKMNCMVFLSLFLIICCFVGSINWFNWKALEAQAVNTLEILTLNQGVRPQQPPSGSHDLLKEQGEDTEAASGGMETPPPKPEGDENGEEKAQGEGDQRGKPENDSEPPPKPEQSGRAGERGQPSVSRESIAGLSNYYTISFDESGEVQAWTSDRPELYDDEQIKEIAAQIRSSGKEYGRIGNQFFRLSDSENDSSLAVVLDKRLEMLSAQELLRNTLILGVAAYVLLGGAAFFLIRRMFIPVEEANRKQKQFVWDASHELKTPLAVISANAEVLERETGKNEWLGYIRLELERTNQLVQNLLELARTDRETTKASMQPFDLSRAILSVTLPFESTVYEQGRSMTTEIPEGIEMVGNSGMIQQLVTILLSNALKYSGPGGKITLSLSVKGRSRIIRVQNTGSFIPAQEREKIFDRFYRVDTSRSREVEGHGLGLAIAKNIVEVHGGKITCESDQVEGTSFTAVL